MDDDGSDAVCPCISDCLFMQSQINEKKLYPCIINICTNVMRITPRPPDAMSISDSNRSSQGQGQGEGERESEGESALALQAAMKELAGLRETRERTEDMVRTHSASIYFIPLLLNLFLFTRSLFNLPFIFQSFITPLNNPYL